MARKQLLSLTQQEIEVIDRALEFYRGVVLTKDEAATVNSLHRYVHTFCDVSSDEKD